ncbi:MAG: hypothetical protein HMLKMBBP_03104 [Planctomycetes bacterium]|nr:hypothetical protein [Planctomycetota bacterium]
MSTEGGPGAPPQEDPATPKRDFAADLETFTGRIVRWIAAVLLTAIALLLGFVPGVPGIPLFIIALFLVAVELRPARALGNFVLRKFKPARKIVPRWMRRLGRRDGGPRA